MLARSCLFQVQIHDIRHTKKGLVSVNQLSKLGAASVKRHSQYGRQYALVMACLCKKTLLEDTEALAEKQAPWIEPCKGYSQLVSWVVVEVHFTGETGFLDFFNLAEITGSPTERYSVLMMFGLVWVCLSYVMPEMRFKNPCCGIYK